MVKGIICFQVNSEQVAGKKCVSKKLANAKILLKAKGKKKR